LTVGDVSMINDSCGRNYPWYGSKNQGRNRTNISFIPSIIKSIR